MFTFLPFFKYFANRKSETQKNVYVPYRKKIYSNGKIAIRAKFLNYTHKIKILKATLR